MHSSQDIDLLTTEQVLEHGGQDRDHSVAVFEQNEEYIDFHTVGSGENVHGIRCYLSTKLRLIFLTWKTWEYSER